MRKVKDVSEQKLVQRAMTREEYNISKNLREFRKEYGLTQRAVAEGVGIHFTNIHQYENGTCMPRLYVLQKLARFYNTTVAALIGANDTNLNAYSRVLPVSQAKEKTVREWFAKLDEQVNEFKMEVLWLYNLDDEIRPIREQRGVKVAEESADIHTVIASILTRMAVTPAIQQEKQAAKNLEAGEESEENVARINRSVYDIEGR